MILGGALSSHSIYDISVRKLALVPNAKNGDLDVYVSLPSYVGILKHDYLLFHQLLLVHQSLTSSHCRT